MLIFLDIETTGLDEKDKICSIGLVVLDKENILFKYDLVNEGKKLSSKASSINHITAEMLKNKPLLQESQTYRFLQENNNEETTLIGHNIGFCLEMLLKCGFNSNCDIINTKRVTKHLISECEEYSLQFLRYELKLYKKETIPLKAFNALDDAMLTKNLYEYLLEISSYEKMLELSFKNVLIVKFEFGKYSGRYLEEISMCDRGYLEWMLHSVSDLDEDLRYSINYYLQGD